MAEVRSFLAIPLPQDLKRSISMLREKLQPVVRNVRWVPVNNLHLTLRFFGDTTQEDLEKIKLSMISVKRAHGAFDVVVKGLGAFPALRRPRVLWLGLAPEAPLRALFDSCQDALEAHGIAPEKRSFQPHLTIGRFRQNRPDLSALTNLYENQMFGTLPVKELILYESRLHPSGAEHVPIHTVTLAGNNGMENNREQK